MSRELEKLRMDFGCLRECDVRRVVQYTQCSTKIVAAFTFALVFCCFVVASANTTPRHTYKEEFNHIKRVRVRLCACDVR